MLVVFVAVGSRGDVQPYVALGRALAARGMRVRVATGQPYQGLVAEAGLEPAAVAHTDPRVALASERGQAWVEAIGPVTFVRRMVRLGAPELERYSESVLAACDGADAIVYSPLGSPAFHVGQARGIPTAVAALQPSFPTREFPSFTLPSGRSLGPVGNRLSHLLVERLGWQLLRRPVDRWRRRLGLPPLGLAGPWPLLHRGPDPILYGYSPTVLPRPADWPPHVHVTGYWFLDPAPGWTPPPELEAFLDAGPPPVYVGFGSMVWRDQAEAWRAVRTALRKVGVRAVVARPHDLPHERVLPPELAGAASSGADPEVHVVGDVPHAWLFPRMAAVVHHAGAGTTAAGLRAGVPAVTCPLLADQPAWAARVHALGAGPRPLNARKDLLLNGVDRLAAAISQAVGDPAMHQAAAALGERIRAEDGTGRAAEVITGWLGTRRLGRPDSAAT